MIEGQGKLFNAHLYGRTDIKLEFVEQPEKKAEVPAPPGRLAELAIGPEFVGSEQGARFWSELFEDIRPALGS